MRCIIVFSLLVLLGHSGFAAHNPNEISYFFKLNEGTLAIHFTPTTAIRIVETAHPEQRNNSTIKLKAFHKDFEGYFKNSFKFYVNGKHIAFKLVESNLNQHDAALLFVLGDIPQNPQQYSMVVTSGGTLFNRPKNHVFLNIDDKKYYHNLDDRSTRANGNFGRETDISLIWAVALSSLFFMLVVVLHFVIKSRSWADYGSPCRTS